MHKANPFEFDDSAPVPPPLPAPPSPRVVKNGRRPWFILGMVVLGWILILVVGCLCRSAYRGYEHRKYGADLVGEWVYDGPTYERKATVGRTIVAFFTVGLSEVAEAASHRNYEYPGWSMDLRADGVVQVRGDSARRWRATGREESWLRVSGERDLLMIHTDISPEWQFQPQANGRMLWKPTPDATPVPLRRKK